MSEKPQHTPGPWKVERVPIQSSGGSNTCFKIEPVGACIYDDWRPRDKGITEEKNVANANLIAAAPDLLHACRAALLWFHTWGLDQSVDRATKEFLDSSPRLLSEAINKAVHGKVAK